MNIPTAVRIAMRLAHLVRLSSMEITFASRACSPPVRGRDVLHILCHVGDGISADRSRKTGTSTEHGPGMGARRYPLDRQRLWSRHVR
jgi:hypothetical protein